MEEYFKPAGKSWQGTGLLIQGLSPGAKVLGSALGSEALGSSHQRWQRYDEDKASETVLRSVLAASAQPAAEPKDCCFTSGHRTPMSGAHTPLSAMLMATAKRKTLLPGLASGTITPCSASGLTSPAIFRSAVVSPAISGSQTPVRRVSSIHAAQMHVAGINKGNSSSTMGDHLLQLDAMKNPRPSSPNGHDGSLTASQQPSSPGSLTLMEMKQLILGSDRDAAHAMTVMPSVEEGKEAGQQLSPAAQNRGRKKRRKIRYVLAALAICLATSGGLASFLPQAEVFRSKLRETRKRSKSRISGTGQ